MLKKKLSSSSLAKLFVTSCLVSVASVAPVYADHSHGLKQAIKDGSAYVDARYRYEYVDQSNIADEAKASTLRTRFGYKTGKYHGLAGQLEFENVTAIGAENYNDGGGTASRSGVPVVADPVDTELNQAFLTYDVVDGVVLKGGRHTLNRGNQRFIGSVDWRQNNQTHDGAAIIVTALADTEIFYGYSYNINRIFGSDDAVGDFGGDIHMIDATYMGLPSTKISAFGYFLDIDDPESQAANASDTYGLRVWGSPEISDGVKLLYDASWATQEDTGDNSVNYDADYYNIEAGVSFAGLTIKAGYEELGSDNGDFAFRTPLATLHKFNGWADQFLVTPAAGLQDAYGVVSYKVNGVNDTFDGTKIVAAYHEFSPDSSGGDYGTEFNLAINKKIAKHYMLGVKYADFSSDENGIAANNDVEKVIFTVGMKFDDLGKILSK
ncbi:MAG: hypothetical protein AAF195_05025 [Pseudomonadota bacterium]